MYTKQLLDNTVILKYTFTVSSLDELFTLFDGKCVLSHLNISEYLWYKSAHDLRGALVFNN